MIGRRPSICSEFSTRPIPKLNYIAAMADVYFRLAPNTLVQFNPSLVLPALNAVGEVSFKVPIIEALVPTMLARPRLLLVPRRGCCRRPLEATLTSVRNDELRRADRHWSGAI